MCAKEAWMWFALTGTPEYYLLFRVLREEEIAEKTV